MRILDILCFLVALSFPAFAADIYLTCDEYERHLNMEYVNPFCTVTGFIATHSQNVVVKIASFRHTIKYMKFYDSTLLYMPFHFFETFDGLKTLDASYTGILELTRNTFSAASNLTHLNLSYNNLSALQTSVFIGANILLSLDLSYNQINELSENAFCGLTNINKIILDGNKLTELHSDIFQDNAYIESVSLENNLLSFVQPEVFNHLLCIKEVNLSRNRLLRIHADTFTEAASLENLLLADNKLQNFQLNNKSIVHQLHLDNNNLTNLTVNATRFVRANFNNISEIYMHQTNQLETLELRGNRLSNILNIINITSLLVLDLSNNPIGPLNVSTFDQLKRLRNLYLRGSGIKNLKFGMFSKQKFLEILDLSFNNLSSLNLNLFVPYLANLKQFYIDGNAITALQGNRTFSGAFPVLQKLGISQNRFNCSYLHYLLIEPHLAETVALHIEPDDNMEETSHIRDVSCISSMHDDTKPALAHNSEEIKLLHQLELLRLHEHALELHLDYTKMLLSVFVVLVVLGLAVILLMRVKMRRSGGASRNSVVVYSNGSMDTGLTGVTM